VVDVIIDVGDGGEGAMAVVVVVAVEFENSPGLKPMENASIGHWHAQWQAGGGEAATALEATTVLCTETGTMSITKVDVLPCDCT